jgi:hypothetical protein
MTPEEPFDRVFASAMQNRQALRCFLDGVTAIQARWHPPDSDRQRSPLTQGRDIPRAITVRKCIFLLGQHADVVACNRENLLL